MRCAACQHDNPAIAVFCAACGVELHAAGRTPSAPGFRSGRVLAVIGFVGFAALLGLTLIRAGGPSRLKASATFELPPAKAAAFFDMLTPDDVHVEVHRRGRRVTVRGSDREITALQHLVTLVTSFDHLSDADARRAIHHLRPIWQDSASYELPWAQREALLRLLSFENVPVLVQRDGTRITIQATRQDRRLIDSVVEILLGQRL